MQRIRTNGLAVGMTLGDGNRVSLLLRGVDARLGLGDLAVGVGVAAAHRGVEGGVFRVLLRALGVDEDGDIEGGGLLVELA